VEKDAKTTELKFTIKEKLEVIRKRIHERALIEVQVCQLVFSRRLALSSRLLTYFESS